MNVTFEQRGAVEILAVNGRIDSTTSAVFETETLKWLERAATHYVIDFSGVTFLSSAALRVLLTMAKRAAKSSRKIQLASPTAEVREIFQISNFTAIFKITNTVDEAVALAAT